MINLAVKVVVVAGFVAVLDLQAEQPPDPRRQAPEPQAASAFEVEVIRLSSQADRVDDMWQVYKEECSVRVERQYAYGREWFSIWDHAAEPTLDAPACRGMLWRLLEAGAVIRRDLTWARVTAQERAIGPGTEIGMLRWHSLDWP